MPYGGHNTEPTLEEARAAIARTEAAVREMNRVVSHRYLVTDKAGVTNFYTRKDAAISYAHSLSQDHAPVTVIDEMSTKIQTVIMTV